MENHKLTYIFCLAAEPPDKRGKLSAIPSESTSGFMFNVCVSLDVVFLVHMKCTHHN